MMKLKGYGAYISAFSIVLRQILTFWVFIIMPNVSLAAIYYVDATGGNDFNNGTATGTPWKTIAKVNNSTFAAGDSILFKAGEVWREQLTIDDSGTEGNDITYSSYGTGAAPLILLTEQVASWSLIGNNVYNATLPASATHSKGILNILGSDLTDTYVIFSKDETNTAVWFDKTTYNENDSKIWYKNIAGDPGTRDVGVRPWGIYVTASDIIIDGIDVNGPPGGPKDGDLYTGFTTSLMAPIFVSGDTTVSATGDRVTVKNCTVKFGRQFGIFYRDKAQSGVIEDNIVLNSAGGIAVYVESHNATVSRNIIKDISTHNGDIGDRGGISVNNSDNVVLQDNYVVNQGVDDHVTTAVSYGVSTAQDCAITVCCGSLNVKVVRNYVQDFAQCGINYGETGGNDGDCIIDGNIIVGGGGTRIRETGDRVTAIRIGGGGKGTPTTNNHGNITITNNTISGPIDATATTADDCAAILIRSYYMDDLDITNNVTQGITGTNLLYALYLDNPLINDGKTRNYRNNNFYEPTGDIINNSNFSFHSCSEIGDFNVFSYATGNICEDPQLSATYRLTASSSATMREGGYDLCGGVPAGCDFDDAVSPDRDWGGVSTPSDSSDDWTQQKYSTSDGTPMGIGAYPYLITNNAPTVEIVVPSAPIITIDVNDSLDFLSNASDAEDDTGSLTVSWDFNDDDAEDDSVLDPAAYTYTVAGTYTATVTVTDTGGKTATDTKTVQVNPVAETWTNMFTSPVVNAGSSISNIAMCEVLGDEDLGNWQSSRIRVKIKARYGGALNITTTSVCLQAIGGDSYDCRDLPKLITFSNSSVVNLTQDQEMYSDSIAFQWDGVDKLVLCAYINNFDGGGQVFEELLTSTYFKSGQVLANDIMAQNRKGYTLTSTPSIFVAVDGESGSSGWKNSYSGTSETLPAAQDVAIREVFSDVNLVTIPGGTTKGRVTFRAPSDSDMVISGASLCYQATHGDPYDCDRIPTRLTFSSANFVTVPAGTDLESDDVTFDLSVADTKVIVHVWLDGFVLSGRKFEKPLTDTYFKSGTSLSDETLVQNVSNMVYTTSESPIITIDGGN